MITSAYVAYLLIQRLAADRAGRERPEAASERHPPRARRHERWLWLAAGTALALLATAILPNIGDLSNACVTLASWSVAHWSCPQPVEASPIATCGFVSGLPPVS
ncbi:MAG TPA: hypothetical protein VFI22_04510 [Thermomicrobiales bacterium]|nr:hypothetical protein [Thermomicrobiales bacterium]